MLIRVLRAKLHLARVTAVEKDYDGSCAIDSVLLGAACIHPFEQIQIYNVTNGERFTTYAIVASPSSGIISVNGAAAHKASPRDHVIICAYGDIDATVLSEHKPRLVYLDEHNHIVRQSRDIAMQIA